jgi:hypothetical protein
VSVSATAICRFYVDFELPTGKDWPSQPLVAECLQEPGFAVAVGFRPKDEQLFPGTDAGMATFFARLTPEGDSTGAALVQSVSAVDRIDVHVTTAVTDLRSLRTACRETELLSGAVNDVAARAATTVLNICRALSGCVTIQPLPREFSVKHNKFVLLCPWSVTWLDTSRPGHVEILGNHWQPGAVKSPVTGGLAFGPVANALQAGAAPLVLSLLVEARADIQAGRLREAILTAATATEVASNLFIDHHKLEEDARCVTIREGRHPYARLSFAERRYHLIPELKGRSLRLEQPQTFASLEQLYRARNSFAHRGKSEPVDFAAAMEFWRTASAAVAWLNVPL